MILASAATLGAQAQKADNFQYTDEKFADIQMLRYKVEGFDKLTLKEKTFIYYLQEAALQGRDILFDQNGRYNLRIRRMLEAVYTHSTGNKPDKPQDVNALIAALKSKKQRVGNWNNP